MSSDKEFASGFPPWHAVVTVVSLLIGFVVLFPSIESIDEVATTETFTKVVFPELISIETLIYTRLAIGIFIIGLTIQTVVFSNG